MQTEESRYDELIDRVEALYEDGRFQEGIEVPEAESSGLDAWIAELAHLKTCLLGVSGDADGALRTLQEASATGAWWLPVILTDDEDLEALQARPEFQELVAESGDRRGRCHRQRSGPATGCSRSSPTPRSS